MNKMKKTKKLDVRKSYSGRLNPNDRKREHLQRSLRALRKGSEFFFDLVQAWCGGLTPEMLEENAKADDLIDLWCAIYWFRPVSTTVATHPINQNDLVATFENYYGGKASSLVNEYLTAPIGEEFLWNDCRQKYEHFCRDFGADFTNDLRTLLRNNLIAVASNKSELETSTISSLFGTGVKASRSVKVEVLEKILNAVQNLEKIPDDCRSIQKIILESAQANDLNEFKIVYSGGNKSNKDGTTKKGNGRPSFLEEFLKLNGDEKLTPSKFKEFFEKLIEEIKKKKQDMSWDHAQRLREYIENNTATKYDAWAWEEMLKSGQTPLKSKATRNYSFTKERAEQFVEIQKNQDLEIVNDLNGFFESEFFNGEYKFVICQFHIGNDDLEKLFKFWNETDADVWNEDTELILNDFCDDLKNSFNRTPIKNVLKYLFQFRKKYTAKQLVNAAKYNEQFDKYKNRKVHPSVLGNQGFTWPNALIPPDKAQRSDRENSLDLRIWLYIKLLHEDGTWKKHHVCFHNSRFFSEVYAAGSNEIEPVKFRTPRFGTTLPKLTAQTPIRVAKKYVKIAKREAKVRLAAQQGLLPKISIPLNELSAVINDSLGVTIPVKFKVDQPSRIPKLNDIILGYDQNQTASHAYSLWQVVEENTPDSFYYEGKGWECHVKFLRSGDVTSLTKTKKDDVIDQLSYEGLDYKNYADWKRTAKRFADNWTISKGKEITPAVDRFESIERWQPRLYRFNKDYAYILRDIVRGKSLAELQQIRPEIFRFITQGFGVCRLGSLSLDALEAVKAAKGVVYSYFSTALNGSKENPISDEQRKEFDPELFKLLEKLEFIRTKKKQQKVDRIGNSVLSIALENQAKFIRGEESLPTTNKSTKKKQNGRSMDWLARGVANKIRQLAEMHEIGLLNVDPRFTSHQDPLVHNNPNKAMKCRYTAAPISEIGDNVLAKLSANLKNKNRGTTGEYYHQGMKEFLEHYGLQNIENDLLKWRKKRPTIQCWELQKILAEKFGNEETVIYFPAKGGRKYFATHKVASDAVSMMFNGKNVWLCNSDHVAAANIALSELNKISLPRLWTKSEQPDEPSDDEKTDATPRNS